MLHKTRQSPAEACRHCPPPTWRIRPLTASTALQSATPALRGKVHEQNDPQRKETRATSCCRVHSHLVTLPCAPCIPKQPYNLDETSSAEHHIPATQVAVPGPSTPTSSALCTRELRKEPELHRCSTTYPKCCLLGLWCRYVYRKSILQLKFCAFSVDANLVQSVVASSFRPATTDGFNCLLTTGSSLKQQSSHSCKCSAAFPPLLWNLEADSHIIAHQVMETLCSPQCTHCFSELHYTTSAVGMPHLLINTGSFKKIINLACPH